MAMFESEGFCPSNSFVHFSNRNQLESRIIKILGDQIGYMVYAENGLAWNNDECSIVDALLGGDDGILGIQVACYLSFLDPHCEYAKNGKKILIRDYINPHQIDKDICIRADGSYQFSFSTYGATWERPCLAKDNTHMFYDDRYLLVIKDGDVIEIGILKLPKLQ